MTITTTQREAALRLADYFTYNFWPGGLNTSGFDETAALLRELAAEPQSDCGEAGHTEGRCGNAACLRGLAEPQSEPVAEDDSYRAVPPKHVATYYAHPPQQRKPLSDEQIYAAISDQVFWATSKNFIVRVVRDVEAAHGITGGKE